MDYVYFSINVQFILNNEDFYKFILIENLLTYEEVIAKPELKDIVRHTFIIKTQIKFSPQQAREVLPLCTYTKVAYTYYLKEWKHIIDLRVNGITGCQHPNAKTIITMVAKKLEKLSGEELIIKEPPR